MKRIAYFLRFSKRGQFEKALLFKPWACIVTRLVINAFLFLLIKWSNNNEK